MRIIADHIRTSVFMIGDEKGVSPSNVDQGYILRRLLRRAVRFAKKLGIEQGKLAIVAQVIVDEYKDVYTELDTNNESIINEINTEEVRFEKTIASG